MSTIETPDFAPDGSLPRDPSPATPLWHAFLLRTAAQRVTGLAEQMLQPQGLTIRHLTVLSAIAAEPGQNQRGVGERLRIDRTTVVALTDDLEDAGLVERRRGADRRMFALYLTPAGRDRLTELNELTAELHERFLVNLSVEERETLRQLLIKLLGN